MTDNPSGKPIILDGAELARSRASRLASRAQTVLEGRGRPPALALMAFADGRGEARWVGRKVEACHAAGVDVSQAILSPDAETGDVLEALVRLLADPAPDAVFMQVPFPSGVDETPLLEAIPVELDVDVMSPAAVARYEADAGAHPPLTVDACLALLDEGGVRLQGRGVVVGPDIPFNRLFREALRRRGVRTEPLVAPDAVDLEARVAAADVVVLSAGRPGVVRSGWLAPDAVAVDAGYFNAGGRGDLDVSDGVDHLGALAPVPGGVGPMTISILVERVIEMAEEVSSGTSPAR